MTMNTQEYFAAAEEVQNWLKRNKAIETLANAIAQIGSLRQAVDEAKTAKTEVEIARNAASFELKKLKEDAAVQAQANADALQAAHNEAALIVGKADEYAAASKEQADQKSLISSAQDEARRANSVAVLGDIQEKINTANSMRLEAEGQAASAQAEVEKIEGKLESAKAAYKAALA